MDRRWRSYGEGDDYLTPDDDPGVEKLYEIGDNGGYDYSITALFRIDGKLYLAHTSGCSCTCPWDEFDNPEDMLYLSALDWKAKSESRKQAWAFLAGQYHDLDERFAMIRAIEKALRG